MNVRSNPRGRNTSAHPRQGGSRSTATLDGPTASARPAPVDPHDAALQVWLDKIRAMHRPEEEAVILDM